MTPGRGQHLCRCIRGRGLTLLEVLVVTVLMAMVAAVTMVSLGATDQAARTMAIIGHVKDIDARGRILAQTSGRQASLVVDDNRLMLFASAPAAAPGGGSGSGGEPEIIGEVGLQHDSLRLETIEPVQLITFDRFGHSADYKISVQGSGGTRQLQVYGLTGVFQETVPSP